MLGMWGRRIDPQQNVEYNRDTVLALTSGNGAGPQCHPCHRGRSGRAAVTKNPRKDPTKVHGGFLHVVGRRVYGLESDSELVLFSLVNKQICSIHLGN